MQRHNRNWKDDKVKNKFFTLELCPKWTSGLVRLRLGIKIGMIKLPESSGDGKQHVRKRT